MTDKDKKVFEKINKNYEYMNKMMVEELDIASEHSCITGNYREKMWIKFFRSIIPQKYSLAQGVLIIDSCGNVSKEVDIAVFDEQYTPYVFQYNTLKFIPIEAVVIAIECKSSSLEDNSLKSWAKSIRKLKPKRSGISRMVGGYTSGLTNNTQVKTCPIKILACIKDNKNTETVEIRTNNLKDDFDFIIQKQNNKFNVSVANGDKSLGWWGDRLNGTKSEVEGEGSQELKLVGISCCSRAKEEKKGNIQKEDRHNKDLLIKSCPELNFDEKLYVTNKLEELEIDNNPLLSLNLQLNQLLMLINNPMLFPHFAYAKAFKDILKK